jgi:hypothetical protein
LAAGSGEASSISSEDGTASAGVAADGADATGDSCGGKGRNKWARDKGGGDGVVEWWDRAWGVEKAVQTSGGNGRGVGGKAAAL